MNSVTSGDRGNEHGGGGGYRHPHPIPSLSFNFSTPTDGNSPVDEFLPQMSKVFSGDSRESTKIDQSCQHESIPMSSKTKKASPRFSIIDANTVVLEPIDEKEQSNNSYDSEVGEKLSRVSHPEVFNRASTFVTEILRRAKLEAQNRKEAVYSSLLIDIARTEVKLRETVHHFVLEVIAKAKEEAAILANAKSAAAISQNALLLNNQQNISAIPKPDSSSSQRYSGRFRGPWYGRVAKFLGSIFGRICQCGGAGQT